MISRELTHSPVIAAGDPFSRSWRNPVQWSHYAAKHTGLCLGFNIPANLLTKVRYSSTRLQARVDVIEGGGPKSQKEMLKVLSTKYAHWRYESEMRLFTRLNDRDPDTGLYFANFSRRMSLSEVIVGPQSTLTRDELHDALGTLGRRVEVYNARLAFRTYTVTRQLDPALWNRKPQRPRRGPIDTIPACWAAFVASAVADPLACKGA
jgi:hypothetical protein